MNLDHVRALVKASGSEQVLLLSGEPGTGKTSFAYWLAEQSGAEILPYLCHHWSSDEDLFSSVNIGAVVEGNAAAVHRPGVLAQAAEVSHSRPVVILLDELDKTSPRFEALLLDFLERWQYPLPDGGMGYANKDNVRVVITHNGMREISAPLQRRAFRFKMPFLPTQVEVSLLGGGKLASLLVKIANAMRSNDDLSSPAMTELSRCIRLLDCAETSAEARDFVVGCLAKSEEDEKFVNPRIGAIWGVAQEARRD